MSNIKWVSVMSVLKIIAGRRWAWFNHPKAGRVKYIELRIDTRDGHCIVKDRNGEPITLGFLNRQFCKREKTGMWDAVPEDKDDNVPEIVDI